MKMRMAYYPAIEKGGTNYEVLDVAGKPEREVNHLLGLVDKLAERRGIHRDEYIGLAMAQFGSGASDPNRIKEGLVEFLAEDIMAMVFAAANRNGLCSLVYMSPQRLIEIINHYEPDE